MTSVHKKPLNVSRILLLFKKWLMYPLLSSRV